MTNYFSKLNTKHRGARELIGTLRRDTSIGTALYFMFANFPEQSQILQLVYKFKLINIISNKIFYSKT